MRACLHADIIMTMQHFWLRDGHIYCSLTCHLMVIIECSILPDQVLFSRTIEYHVNNIASA